MNNIGWIVIIAVLFLLVLWNSRRNVRRWRKRKGKSFRDNYYERKKEQGTDDEKNRKEEQNS
ncbi:hypothetical protein LS482_18160 [Sinomicrobium kalidii]|uniref:hypothetical protein n=1 Tax=Sinomicrobium kalidii TaxID=2900738 RepID=UPI001E4C806F|nr:hypothetical protein [Sinomicrobium kalidii]UGU15593.1 hypothetical protein LS482_18160 [Sinomicrobium kalidii]